MPRKESEAVPEGNGLVPQREEIGSGEPTLADVYRLFEERFDRQQEIMDSFFDGMSSCFDRWNMKLDEKMDQHVTPGAWSLAATSRHGGRRASRHEDSRAHGGRHNSSTSNAGGWLLCMPG